MSKLITNEDLEEFAKNVMVPIQAKPRVFNGNVRFNIYYDSNVVYTGNSYFTAFMYKVMQKFNKRYYVGRL